MDIENLRLFICLAENLSFTKVAKQMYISQSSLSNKITELESTIGVPLLERTTRSVQLTPAGTYFLDEAKYLVNRFHELTMRTRQIANGNMGTLSVGYLDLVGADVVEMAVVNYCRKHPDVNLQLRKMNYPDLLKHVGEMDLDLAFIMTNELGDSLPIVGEPILSSRLMALMNEDHPLAQRKMLKIAELKDEPMLVVDNLQSKELTEAVSLIFARQGITPNIVRECAGPEELSIYVAAGYGIGIVSHFFSVALARSPSLRMIPLSHITEPRNMYVFYHSGNPNGCIQSFLRDTRELAKKLADENSEYDLPDMNWWNGARTGEKSE